MIRRPRISVSAICCVLFGLLAPGVGSAQTAQQPTRPGAEDNDNRQDARERQRLYENYFREICQKKQLCDDTCNQVYRSLENKDQFVWKCP
jgi:hypothetical protein